MEILVSLRQGVFKLSGEKIGIQIGPLGAELQAIKVVVYKILKIANGGAHGAQYVLKRSKIALIFWKICVFSVVSVGVVGLDDSEGPLRS